MSSLIEGYNYDIFISYRQKDNKHDGWVSEFVNNLKGELESTFKEEISVYFDINPHDGLLETHDVDASLKEKLKCLIFIPIISRTYCDPKSFAWEHEFKAFVEMASKDQFGLKVKLPNGNVSSRVLPIQIHEITQEDKITVERLLGGVLRPVEFIYKESGVNRPLRSNELHPDSNQNKTDYLNQINKVANAIEDILTGLKNFQSPPSGEKGRTPDVPVTNKGETKKTIFSSSFKVRNKLILFGSVLGVMAIIATVLFLFKKPVGSDSFESMTMPITIINEDGQKETRRVFKESYITNLSLFPFSNETNDTTTSWLQNGFPYGISLDLGQFNYISIGGLAGLHGTESITHLQEQINYSKQLNSTFFITGGYKVSDGIFDVTIRIYETSNGKTVSERNFRGNDFFSLIDSISLSVRYDLNIPNSVLDKFTDLPLQEQTTSNLTAFRYFVTGMFGFWSNNIGENLNKSIELDSTFALGLYQLAKLDFALQFSESAFKYIDQAMRHRQRLSQYDEISIRILYYLIHGEGDKAIRLSELQYEMQPSASILERLVDSYEMNFNIPKLESSSEKLYLISPGNVYYQFRLAKSYLFSGEYDKGLNLMKQALKNSPDNIGALLQMAELYLLKKELEKAEKCYQKAKYIQPELEKTWSWISDYISFIQKNDIKSEFYEQFTGNYRSEGMEQSFNFFLHNDLLVSKSMNQGGDYCYPVSETDFIPAYGSIKQTFIKNSRNSITKMIIRQNPDLTNWKLECWKEDSLISKAMSLIKGNDKKAALDAFRNAWSQNPDHYYLKNFIQHLEFIQAEEYDRMKTKSGLFEGKYGILTISRKNDAFYCTDNKGLNLRLLPLSESSFMCPSIYAATYHIISRNDKITGLEVLHHNGEKVLFPKNN